MPRGLLWVASRIVNAEGLTEDKFCEWYENTHIQEVLVLAGFPAAARYEALQPQPDAKAFSNEAPWLTVYEMPDVAYRESEEFKQLIGQSPLPQELIEGVFKNARFDTRFYEEVQCFENPEVMGKGPATYLISAALQPPKGTESDFDTWYRKEHIPLLSRAPGFLRTRRYELVNATVLDCFERTEDEKVPKYLAHHEFNGDALPWKELGEIATTEWAKKVMGGLVGEEVGWYRIKKVYAESEWGSVGVKA
ncbi:hypothetical protein EJ02DRAFT_453168 [Clathrospora elynae]|uniref:EthD domain-containing protein n=1 Tax=Clathrospora elynae TaxID=706981 RepID=A0A6A5SU28_9PLEO|nr:hypothetical protein EJ02DRAFT_453168 [Clathrospora elynae]